MLIIGHRGARREAPENTLAGFRYLRSLGVHHVELDVRLSQDQQLVVIHDDTLNRTTAHSGNVRDFTAAALAQMNAAAKFAAGWPDTTPVPLLRDVLKEWDDLESIQLEVKTTHENDLRTIAHLIRELVDELDLIDTAIVTSMDTHLLGYMHQTAPEIRRGYVAERFTREPLAMCQLHHCTHLITNYHRVTPGLVQTAHSIGLEVSVWTVNDLNIAHRIQHCGADSIITDVPSLMLNNLRHDIEY